MKLMPAILTAALENAKPLADRVSAVLSTPASSSAMVAALLPEVTEALAKARTAAQQAEAHALDPVLDTVAAGRASDVAKAAAFTVLRLEAAETRLTQFHAQRAQEEREAEQWTRYREVEKARDAAAEKIKLKYPDLAHEIVELIKVSIDTDQEVRRVNNDLPSGAPRLNMTEAHARGYCNNGRDGDPKIQFGVLCLTDAVIPDFERFEYAQWPLRARADGIRGARHLPGEHAAAIYLQDKAAAK
jgi:hypothetical protein